MNIKKEKFNWNVSAKLNSNIDALNLWKIISAPSNLELFHPFCKKNLVIKWPGEGAIDEIYYYSNLVYQRKFINWIDNAGYDLLIGERNGKQSFVSWRIEKDSNATLTISIYPYKYNTGSKLLNFLPYHLFVRPLLKKYISSVITGLDYYIKNNKRVNKNQFGKLRFFSN